MSETDISYSRLIAARYLNAPEWTHVDKDYCLAVRALTVFFTGCGVLIGRAFLHPNETRRVIKQLECDFALLAARGLEPTLTQQPNCHPVSDLDDFLRGVRVCGYEELA